MALPLDVIKREAAWERPIRHGHASKLVSVVGGRPLGRLAP